MVKHVHFDGDRAQDLVLLPAISEDALLDDVLDHELRLSEEDVKGVSSSTGGS